MTTTFRARMLMPVVMALTVTACASYSTSDGVASVTDDLTINKNVHTAVIAVPGVQPDTMQSHTKDGVVTLTGTVQSQLAAQNAIQAARQVHGVKMVDYELNVAQP